MSKPLLYQSYLLRLWVTERNGNLPWRASLENPATGERIGFSSLEQLFMFLHTCCSEAAMNPDRSDTGSTPE